MLMSSSQKNEPALLWIEWLNYPFKRRFSGSYDARVAMVTWGSYTCLCTMDSHCWRAKQLCNTTMGFGDEFGVDTATESLHWQMKKIYYPEWWSRNITIMIKTQTSWRKMTSDLIPFDPDCAMTRGELEGCNSRLHAAPASSRIFDSSWLRFDWNEWIANKMW